MKMTKKKKKKIERQKRIYAKKYSLKTKDFHLCVK